MVGGSRRVGYGARRIDKREKSGGDGEQAHHGDGAGSRLISESGYELLVIFASKWGLPVSTTHVSCGALFGIGIVNGQAHWGVIRTILLAWVLTLPFAGISAGVIYMALSELAA